MHFSFFIKSVIFNTTGNGCTDPIAPVPVASAPEKGTKVQQTIAQKECFIVEDQKTAFLAQCDIPELKLMSRLNEGWKQLSENDSLWQKIGISLESTDLLHKEQVKKYYYATNNHAHVCFDSETLHPEFRNELNRLYNSERIGDINHLREACKARDILVVWRELQQAIGGNIDLKLSNFDSIETLFNKAGEFHEWFEINLNRLSSLERLDLRYNKLTSLPAEIGKLAALQYLYLSNNQLTSLPAEIGKLVALQALDLDDNQLTSLPAEIGNLAALQSLFLNNNQLISLPTEIGNLAALKRLFLDNSQLTSLPAEIGNLTALQHLLLQNNQLTSLPAEIGNLRALQMIQLTNNQLNSLPAEIGDLAVLERLDLQNNELTCLPSEIGNLGALQMLQLYNNQLTSLPREFRNLGLDEFYCDASLRRVYLIQKLIWAIEECCCHATEDV